MATSIPDAQLYPRLCIFFFFKTHLSPRMKSRGWTGSLWGSACDRSIERVSHGVTTRPCHTQEG